jgi:hypothetical protein
MAVLKVVLIIAAICSRPEPDEIWNTEPPSIFIPGIEASLWGAVVELAMCVAFAVRRISVSHISAIIIAMLIPKIRGIPMSVAETIIKNAIGGFGDEGRRWILSAIHWTVNHHIADATEIAVGILQHIGALKQ